MPKEWVYPATLKYRNFDKWANVVRAAGNSAVQHSCSEFNVSNFQNKRGVIQSTMEENLRLKLEGTEERNYDDGVYARAISLQLSNVDLPEEYSNAVAEKQSANEDISLAKNQRTQQITKAQTELNTAREEARKISDNALNDANITIAEAKLQAEETIYRFAKEKEILVGVKETLGLTTNGLMAYLSNQLYAAAPHLSVSAEEPVQLSRKLEIVEEL
jgi:prohibitin 2